MYKALQEIITQEINQESETAEKLKKKRAKLAKYSGIKLKYTRPTNNKRYYSSSERIDGKLFTKYIGPKNQMVTDIQTLRVIDETLNRIETNTAALTHVLDVIESPELLDVINDLPSAYQDFDTSKIETIDSKTQKLYNEMLERKKANPHPNTMHLRHRVTPELIVRSKSEALIATELLNRHVLFLYEAPLEINGETIYPDFMIFHNGRIFIIEHLGLLNEEKYFRKYFIRFKNYADAGYNIDTRLFITFDDPDGNINLLSVRKTIDVILAS